MLPIDQLVSQLREGDVVQLVTENNERILGFYDGDTKFSYHNEMDQIRIGSTTERPQKMISMLSTNGLDPEEEDYCLGYLLPELYLTFNNGIYQIGNSHKIKEGRILNPSNFGPVPNEPADPDWTIEDSFREMLSSVFRLTLPGKDNYVVANVVGLGEVDPRLLLSPISGWSEFPLYVELSEDSSHEGTLHVPERSLFLDEPDPDEGRHLVTSFRKIPVTNLEYYTE